MTVTGAQIRARILQKYRALGLRGAATADGTTTTVVDTLRFRGDTLPAGDMGVDAWIRFLSGSVNNAGFVGKLDLVDGVSGTLTFSPAAPGVTKASDKYEIWRQGIRPDEPDAAMGRGLTVRCSMWRVKQLSVFTDVETWVARATETPAPTTMTFPEELAQQSNVVNNNGVANGGVKSESYYAQPTGAPGGVQAMRFWGNVSVQAGTGKFRIRDITNGADIALVGLPAAGFTLRGRQRFDGTFPIPAGCQEIQVWPSGTGAGDIVEWSDVGVLPMNATRFNLPGRVLSETELGRIYARRTPAGNHLRPLYVRLPAEAHRSAALVEIVFGTSPANIGAVEYMEQHHYAALQPDYLTAADRTTGDAATTDCQLDYIAAATVVELLEDGERTDLLNKVFLAAEKDLGFWDRKVGASPIVIEENVPATRGPLLMRL